MSYDKLINSKLFSSSLTSIADAIRTKTGSKEKINIKDMAKKIIEINNETYVSYQFYECASVSNSSWSGYAWEMGKNGYKKSNYLTNNLIWSSIKPVVGETYSQDALMKIDYLFIEPEESDSSYIPEIPPVEPDEPEESEDSSTPEVEYDYPFSLRVTGATDYIDPGVWNVDGIYNKSDELNEGKPVYKNTETPNKCIKYNNGYWRIYSYDAVSDYLYICQSEGNLDLSVNWTANTVHVIGVVSVVKHNDTEEPSTPDTPTTDSTYVFKAVHTDPGSVDFSGNYVDNGDTYEDKTVYIHEDDVNKTGSELVHTVYHSGSSWRVDYITYDDIQSGYLTGGSPYFDSSSTNTSPVGLTFSPLKGSGTIIFEDVTTGGDNSDSSDDSEEPDVTTPLYIVLGGGDAVNGNYSQIDDVNGAPAYKHVDKEMYIYKWNGGDYWMIADSLTAEDPGYAKYYADGGASADITTLDFSRSLYAVAIRPYTSEPISTVIISGATELPAVKGTYMIINDNSTGTSRVWVGADNLNQFRIKYDGGTPGWILTGNGSEYSYYTYESDNPYNDEATATWYYQGSVSSLQCILDTTNSGDGTDTPSDSVEPVSFTIKDAIEWDDVNGVYTQTEDTYGKTGKEAIYTMTSSNGTFKCFYISEMHEWHIDKEGVASRYYSPNDTDNPWDATNWYEYSTGLEDRSIKVELN